MAYAGACFADSVLRGLDGASDVVECSYVESTITDAAYFSTKVKLGASGVEEIYGVGSLTAYEQEGLDAMMGELKAQIQKGIDFVHQS
jgi:malate dehydrogenase